MSGPVGRRGFAAVVMALALTAPARGASVRPAVARHADGGALRMEASLAGRLIDWAVTGSEGHREILLLVGGSPEPEPDPEGAAGAPAAPQPPPPARRECSDNEPADGAAGPRPRLLAFDPIGGSIRMLADDLPSGCLRVLTLRLRTEGSEEIVLACPEGLHRLDLTAGTLALLVADPDAGAGVFAAGDRGAAAAAAPPLRLLGGARFYGPQPGGGWGAVADVTLPLRVTRSDDGFRLQAAPLRVVGRAGATGLHAFGPQRVGARRLRTLLLDPSAGGKAAEIWSQLPAAEMPLESAYLFLDGRPVLMVTSRPADKLSFFGEKLLRIFPLDEKDRSRTGSAPLLAAESRANLWQRMQPVPVDLDGDGRQELVTAYWKGLKDARVVLDAWLRRPDGSFETSPVSTEFDVEGGDKGLLLYGEDLDADGRPDLVLHAKGRLQIHRGAAPRRPGRGLVETQPRWSIPAAVVSEENDFDFGFSFEDDEGSRDIPGATLGTSLQAIDLDGDGRREIVIPEGPEPGTFVVVKLAGEGDAK